MFESTLLTDLRDVAAGVARVASLDVAGCTDAELVAAVEVLESTRRATDAARARVATELDRRRATQATDGLHTPGWLAWRHGLPRPQAAALVRTGRFLAEHPTVEGALTQGAITWEHACHLARCCTPRVAHVVAALAEQLVDLARGVRFETWAREVRTLLAHADPDGGHRPTPDGNRLAVTTSGDGSVHLRGELVGEWALEFTAALGAQTDQLFRTTEQDAAATGGATERPPRAQLQALALVELVRRGRAARRATAAPISDVTIVLTTPPTLSDHLRRPTHPDADWLRQVTAECLAAHTLDGVPIHPSTAALLTCDAAHRVLVETFSGETLALGRARRLASRAQRRAALRRHGGCCFPGCDAPPAWVELHHAPSWEAGGPTDLEHLAPLCRHHHGIVHRPDWQLEPDRHHGFTITTPSGRRLPAQTHGRIRQPAPLRT